jgi:hypothetical protein
MWVQAQATFRRIFKKTLVAVILSEAKNPFQLFSSNYGDASLSMTLRRFPVSS